MPKTNILDKLKPLIETQAHIQSINRQVQQRLGHDLSTLYILSLLQESPVGIGVKELAKALQLSASALSI
ncbi:hypothetical protein [Furfurilactobacillus entadae]|uniref:hypothetical protein n=1 Tax=Furfurilactobacillus entadae TaxID=2922307 RepID=UPI0035E6EF0A